jgi:hypothetical protein
MTVAANRALTIPLALLDAFQRHLQARPASEVLVEVPLEDVAAETEASASGGQVAGSSSSSSAAMDDGGRSGSGGGSSSSIPAVSNLHTRASSSSSAALDLRSFANFYSHFEASARLFEIFDASDTTLWEHPLPFAHVFVFATAAHAARAQRAFPDFLMPVEAARARAVESAKRGGSADGAVQSALVLAFEAAENVTFQLWYECERG